MLDLKQVREDPQAFDTALARRGAGPRARDLLAFDDRRRHALTEAQAIQAERNRLSKEIGDRKRRGENADDVLAEVARSKERQAEAEDSAKTVEAELDAVLAAMPNLLAADVPDGVDENDNVEVRRWGDPPAFSFTPRDHVALGEGLGLMDFERAARLSGARFVILSGALARMERALAAFMLDLHTTEFGYTEVNPPALVRDAALFGTGQLPKFADDLFHTDDGYWLIPTAEVPLTNLAAESIVDAAELPYRFTAMTWCFRSEAGSAGKDTRGMIRQHQFSKVELVSITPADQSIDEHERMTGCAEAVLQRLGLPYRTMVLCAGDTGFSARKTYDIEAWLPAQDRYREISSCSNCGDFQARRMQARYRVPGEKGTRYVHTLNGSGLAIGRTLIAILENYQHVDGSVTVPEVLRPYMNGLALIEPRRSDGG